MLLTRDTLLVVANALTCTDRASRRFRNRGNSLRAVLEAQPHLRFAMLGAYAAAEFRGTGNVDGPDQRLVSDGG